MGYHKQSVIFVDLDYTLFNGPFEYAVELACAELAGKSTEKIDTVRHMVKEENLDRMNDPDISAILAMDWDDVLQTVSERLKVQLETNVEEFVRSHCRVPYLQLLDDSVYQVLEQLSTPNRAIVVATNGLKKYQIPPLDALGLTPLFDGILTPDTHGVLKSERAFYGSWPESAHLQVMVGDDYEYDVLAPYELGFAAVWKPRIQDNRNWSDDSIQNAGPFLRSLIFNHQNGQHVYPDAIIFGLSELPEVITQLEELALRTFQDLSYQINHSVQV